MIRRITVERSDGESSTYTNLDDARIYDGCLHLIWFHRETIVFPLTAVKSWKKEL